jgi:amicyanin
VIIDSTLTRPVQPTPARPAPPRTTAPTGRVVRATIRNLSYLQTRIEITAGTTIEWTNRDPLPHSVTAVDKSFDSGLIQPDKTFRRTFTRAGTYDFYCVPHPFMKGVVVVRPAP